MGGGPNPPRRFVRVYAQPMRLFVAIGLPSPLSDTLSRAARTLITLEAQQRARTTFTRPDNLHLTLNFLGQVDPSRLEEIQQTLATRGEISHAYI